MPKTEAELFSFLDSLGIKTATQRHPPLYTVADSQALRGEIAGGHTKNLFLKDKKDNFFLLTVDEDAIVDLKRVHTLIGAASRVSFGKPEMLMELLVWLRAPSPSSAWSTTSSAASRSCSTRC